VSGRRTIAAALLAGLLAGCLFWLPAALFARALPKDLHCARISGSVWNGHCSGLSIRGSRSGELSWALQPPRWTPLGQPISIAWRLGDSRVDGVLTLGAQGLSELQIVGADLSLQTVRDALPADLGIGPLAGVAGRLQTNALTIQWHAARVNAIRGSALLRDARLLRFDVGVGNFGADFSGTAGTARDLGGPLEVAGEMQLGAEGRYQIKARVSTRTPQLRESLSLAAPVDLAIEGQL
jgi:hypothetical protein